MDGESSNTQETIVKNSISENLGTKTKQHQIHEPLIKNDDAPVAVLDMNSTQEENTENDGIGASAISRLLPDINAYQNKKTVGTGMMDIALLVTNVNQLRHILHTFDRNPYFYVSLSLVISSIILQVIVGVFLIINSRYDVKDCEEVCKADRINNWCTSLIFIITAINVVLGAFEIPDN
ncbi:hypothetical protein PVAND_007881 [Polypedilum vanderplanki]|uniref:Ninjurin-1 n=1 Tax=Polypedilum vanderplanki TaxID=319348 RepID=A0A9J6C7P7_POLVA|nr:hypothetical protein PVAND_007881 [Polypedilum vanderplanki]